MSAKRLGRFAGLVFVLAAVIGGVVTTASAEHGAGGAVAATTVQAAQLGDIIWE
jgi:hypothetical protein